MPRSNTQYKKRLSDVVSPSPTLVKNLGLFITIRKMEF